MNFRENIREGIKSIKQNTLRTVLTGLIIAIGITSLVGMLTAVDGIKSKIESSLSGLGANNFDVDSRSSGRRSFNGKRESPIRPLNSMKPSALKKTMTSQPK